MVETTHDQPGLFRRLWRSVGSDRVRLGRFVLNTYGKLPIYKDFITTGLTDPAAREFRVWLDRGFSHRWSEDDLYRNVEIPSHSFLFRLPQGRGCVAGSLWGSTDEGGLRRFPFTLFLTFPADQPAADPLTAVDYLALVEARARDLRERFVAGAPLASLHQTYRGASIECPLKSRDQIRREVRTSEPGIPLSAFADSLLGPSCAPVWPSFLDEFIRAAASENVGAIRIPLGGALPRVRELEFWLLWLAQQEGGRRRPVCGLLYPNGQGNGRATLFFRDLRAEDIFLLHSMRVKDSDVRELPTVEPRTAAQEASAGESAPVVEALRAVESTSATPPEETPTPEIEWPQGLPVGAVAASDIAAPDIPPEDSSRTAPFLEAETQADPEIPGFSEPLLLDSRGQPRLTQAPFALPTPSKREVGPAETSADSLATEVPEPAEESSRHASQDPSGPTTPASPVEGAGSPTPDPPVSPDTAEEPSVAASRADPATPPSGWEGPVFALLEG